MSDHFLRNAMEAHGDTVYRLALCRTQNAADAEDVYQDVFLRLLGQEDYQVIEEGYCGRTTCFSDDSDEMRSGIKVLNMVLKTHCPSDMVIIMLGTNDFKAQFSMKAKVSAFGVKKIVE